MQFHGEYIHRLDPQGRVAIPSRFRDVFRGGLVLSKGLDSCVWAFSHTSWEAWSSEVAARSPKFKLSRVMRRRTFGSAFDLELDRQGRVLVPQPLRVYAGLKEEVVLVGNGDYLELWDKERWESEELPAVEEAMARMASIEEEQGAE
jgi:MraZ protein